MKKVTGVRFKKSGKIYFFEIGEFNLEKGMHVIVDKIGRASCRERV